MADYNIWIRSFNNADSPTTPIQLRQESDISGTGGDGGSGGSGFGFIRRASQFLINPDSAIGEVANTAVGTLKKAAGVAAVLFVVSTAIKLTDKVVTIYNDFSSEASGDYANKIKYNNFKQLMHNAMTPFSNQIQMEKTQLQIMNQNAKNEQERLLFGGTIYNSKYGRYL